MFYSGSGPSQRSSKILRGYPFDSLERVSPEVMDCEDKTSQSAGLRAGPMDR